MLRQRPAPRDGSSTSTTTTSSTSPPPPSASTTAMANPRQPLLERKKAPVAFSSSSSPPPASLSQLDGSGLEDSEPKEAGAETVTTMADLSASMSRQSQWISLAIASGACAAFNGVFAKLTTTELTTSFATGIASLLGLGPGEKVVEVIIRVLFFVLNLVFNGVMWTLFTKALARGTSTTQVSIINTSANFIITALLGFIIFSESLPPLWWLGAALLVAGNVIIGRREEKEVDPLADIHNAAENGEGRGSGDADALLRTSVELTDEMEAALKRQHEEEDILDLGDEIDVDATPRH